MPIGEAGGQDLHVVIDLARRLAGCIPVLRFGFVCLCGCL